MSSYVSAPHNEAFRWATEKQLAFIQSLVKDRLLDETTRTKVVEGVDHGFSVRQASEVIDLLMKLPRKPSATASQFTYPEMPAEGRYALDVAGVLKFYKVDQPRDGKWAGRTFVKAVGGPNEYPIRDPHKVGEIIVAIRTVGVQQAMARYGQELGHCGACGLPLTDETSRTLGIGPVCRNKGGW